jgi:AAA+ ATPase superfamily predicted ATPase
MLPANPFLTSGYKGPQYFCNREKETAQLLSNMKNNINTTLFAIRRIGKTGLIYHALDRFSKSKKTAAIYFDIFATQNLKDFTNQFATAVYRRFPEKKGIGQKFFDMLRLFRPVISYDALTGNPEISIELTQHKQYEKTIEQLFAFLDKQKIKIIIAIDEFQQILHYPEQNTEALLRTHIQFLKNTSFIFCGSNQKMMNEIFNSARRPFYASCSNMKLDFIREEDYSRFIEMQFKKNKRKISAESIKFIMDFTQRHTYYTQALCNYIFGSEIRNITPEAVHEACSDILTQNENTFYQYRNLLTGAQWQLLTAIAKEERVKKPHSSGFIKKYKLGTSSLITRGIESLLAKEMIYYETGIEEPYYAVYDKFLMRWLQ